LINRRIGFSRKSAESNLAINKLLGFLLSKDSFQKREHLICKDVEENDMKKKLEGVIVKILM